MLRDSVLGSRKMKGHILKSPQDKQKIKCFGTAFTLPPFRALQRDFTLAQF